MGVGFCTLIGAKRVTRRTPDHESGGRGAAKREAPAGAAA
jgi:hypothetical protein